MDPGVARGEFDQLARRVELIETRGSSGVQALQVQVNDLIKDVTKLEASVETKFAAHELEHRQDAAARVSGRRWLVGTMIAAAMLLLTILGLVISIAGQGRM